MKEYVEIVLSTLHEMGNEDNNQQLLEANEKTKLFGSSGVLDSVGIVFLITELEEKVYDEFDVEITLADERAMSQRTSPFRNVESLAKYLSELVLG